MPRPKKIKEENPPVAESSTPGIETKPVPPKEPTVEISQSQFQELMGKIKMLEAVADKGRLFDYETKQSSQGKKPIKVKLALFGGGIIVGWRTVKDDLIKHPTTGITAGEVQEYEVMVLGNDSHIQLKRLNGYPAFSDARYNERIEVEVISRSTDFNEKVTYTVALPDGRNIQIGAEFVN